MEILYGPTFGDEVIAAGLGGLPLSWSETEIFGRESLDAAQNTQLDGVIAEHDPTQQKPPSTSEQLAFDHENRIRALEGQPPLSLDEFLRQT